MRRVTRQSHHERINQVLFYIHAHLTEPLDIPALAQRSCYSVHHFQRIFKQVAGESAHAYIRRARLEWAANLLVFNPDSSIMDVAADCGFQSNASFTHAFREYFGTTPSAWRAGGYLQTSRSLKERWTLDRENPNRHYYTLTDLPSMHSPLRDVQVITIQPLRVVYIRHTGYDHRIGDVWKKLIVKARHAGIDSARSEMVGLYHSNPDLIPYEKCRYVACLTLDEYPRHEAGLDCMSIPGGEYATLDCEGRYGDLIYTLHRVYHEWLPQSEFETLNIPPHVIYHENHFLNPDGRFSASLRVPVRYRL